jgi:hypothetical protein
LGKQLQHKIDLAAFKTTQIVTHPMDSSLTGVHVPIKVGVAAILGQGNAFITNTTKGDASAASIFRRKYGQLS